MNEPYKPNARETRIQIIKFALFSASAGIIETAAFTVLDMVTPWKYWPCYLIALVLSVPWNFTLNREFTFKSANNVSKAMMQIFLFYCVFTPLSTWWGNALTGKSRLEQLRRPFSPPWPRTLFLNIFTIDLWYTGTA